MSVTEQLLEIASGGDLASAAPRIKDAVGQELSALDPEITLTTTPYFNHSFAPDLVVHWSERGVSRERPVFLRGHIWTEFLGEELEQLGEISPLLIGLFDRTPQVEEGREDTGTSIATFEQPGEVDNSLVTEVEAVDALRPEEQEDRAIATSAIVRGGRGFLDRDAATDLEHGIDRVLQSAVRGEEANKVLEALANVESWLTEPFSKRFELYTKLLWLGAGADLRQLGSEDLRIAELDDSELRPLLSALLTRHERLSSYLWTAIGAQLDPDRLAALVGETEVSENLNDLVNANTESWQVKRAAIDREEELTAHLAEGWLIRRDNLAYQSGTTVAYFTGIGTHFNNWQPVEEQVSWQTLLSRAGADGIKQIELKLPGARVIVIREGEDPSGVLSEIRHLSEADVFEGMVSVVEVELHDGAALTVDFHRGQAISAEETELRLNTMLDVVRRYLLPMAG
jgi:hypothetical protein